MAIERTEDYEAESLGGRLQQLAADADAIAPGLGDALLADWNAWWVPTQEAALAQVFAVVDSDPR